MIVIETKYSPATDTRGAAIVARQLTGNLAGRRLRMSYDYAASVGVNHLRAAEALFEQLHGAYASCYGNPQIASIARGYMVAFI